MAAVALLMAGDFITYRGSKTNSTPQFVKYLPSTKPISNNIHIGIANNIWEITSGGVNNIPTKKANNIIYGRLELNFSIVIKLYLINKMVAIGISNDMPKAKNSLSIKSR